MDCQAAIRCLRFGYVVVLLAQVGCRNGTPAPTGGTQTAPSKTVLQRNVELTVARRQALVYRVETIGVLEAEGQTDIAAGVTGVVDQVLFREGDEVLPGTLLATIDQPRFQAEEQMARATADRAKTNMDLARDLNDRADRAGLSVSQEDRAKLRFQVGVAEAEYRSTVSSHHLARIRLDRSRVHAPYAGRINRRLVTVGSYLEEKTTVATIADLSHIRLAGYIPESAAPSLREMLRYQAARLTAARLGLCLAGTSTPGLLTNLGLIQRDMVLSGFDPEFELLALPGQTYHGRIFFMSTVANPDTHMFEAKAEVLGWSFQPDLEKVQETAPLISITKESGPERTLAFPQNGPKRSLESSNSTLRFWPGFTARIRFPLRSNPSACLVPEEAVRASEKGFIAFLPVKKDRDGKAEWIVRAQELKLGYRADGWVEVLQGLNSGDWLVRRGAEALEDGTPVRFKDGPK